MKIDGLFFIIDTGRQSDAVATRYEKEASSNIEIGSSVERSSSNVTLTVPADAIKWNLIGRRAPDADFRQLFNRRRAAAGKKDDY